MADRTEILGVAVQDWYGVRRALHAITPVVVSPEQAAAAIDESRPEVVVFGCYQPAWAPVLAAAFNAGATTVLTWYASYILNEFDPQNRAWMYHALQAAKAHAFDFVATPHEGLAATWTHYGIRTDVLPPTIGQEAEAALHDSQVKAHGLNIGLFGSGMPWKNMECQLLAAAMLPEARLHVQGLPRDLGSGFYSERVTKHRYRSSDASYYQLVGSMTVNLCVSLSETFSFLSAESLLMGVPIVTSTIAPIFKDAPEILQSCRTPYFEDPMAIAATIRHVLSDYDRIRAAGRAHMLELNRRNRLAARAVIARWFY